MLEIGTCFTLLSRNRDPHLFVLLTEPSGKPLGSVVVNLTSYKSDFESDTTVVLEEGHSFIKKKTVVNYRQAHFIDVTQLEAKLKDPDDQASLHKEQICSQEFLEKLQQGLLKSPNTNPKLVAYCKDKF